MNNDLKEYNYVNELFDLYKNLLTDKQRDVMEKYFSFDLSLSEVSEELGISRSAVLDTIEHAKTKLTNYEEKLHLLKKFKKIESLLDDESVKKEIKEEIIKELYYGI